MNVATAVEDPNDPGVAVVSASVRTTDVAVPVLMICPVVPVADETLELNVVYSALEIVPANTDAVEARGMFNVCTPVADEKPKSRPVVPVAKV